MEKLQDCHNGFLYQPDVLLSSNIALLSGNIVENRYNQ